MPNISNPELAETKVQTLPPADLETLKKMREEMCSSDTFGFKLDPEQRFLRRVMSPDSPTRSLFMVHGTGAGKTCTAIQIAEEYIIRPEFQDKKVLVLAGPAIQLGFKDQIFSLSRIKDVGGELMSQQCTGRRYWDMVQRISEQTPKKLTDVSNQKKVQSLVSRIIDGFYEFLGYDTLANMVFSSNSDKWIHDNFDNRLIIVDEAHNLRDIYEGADSEVSKRRSLAIERIIKVANGVTLVLLSATPMYDSYDEILYYFTLFLWNERRLDRNKKLTVSEIFKEDGSFKEGSEVKFRGWCQDYVSFIKGENPFKFPFRLPPPKKYIAKNDRTTDVNGSKIERQLRFLPLVASIVEPLQEAAIKTTKSTPFSDPNLICTHPDQGDFRTSFKTVRNKYAYVSEKFLAPSEVHKYSSKFALIMKILKESSGVAFVFSNLVENGAQLFSMCLEEHGYAPAIGSSLLATSGEIAIGSVGKYVLLTSDVSDLDIKSVLNILKDKSNADGSKIRVIVASPKVSEGIDFRFVRQVHILDPWYNMSRIEQVIGRGIRKCSHALLPFEKQNCTVFLHVCRFSKSTRETIDEYKYRVFVEGKAIKIAKVRRVIMESAMDCELQSGINILPDDWKKQEVPQISAIGDEPMKLKLEEMFSPSFMDDMTAVVCKLTAPEKETGHVRPLSSIMDSRDEIFDKLSSLFAKKPIWKKDELFNDARLRSYGRDILTFIIEDAIKTGLVLRNKMGVRGHIESVGKYIAFSTGSNQTLIDRLLKDEMINSVDVIKFQEEEEPTTEITDIESKIEDVPEVIKSFSKEVLEWYVVDNILGPAQKARYILSLKEDKPFSSPLRVGDILMGIGKAYDSSGKVLVPVGKDADKVSEWISELDNKVKESADVFASLKEGKLVFNLDKTAKTVVPAKRSKTIGGMVCDFFNVEVLNMLIEWLSGEGFPAKVKSRKDKCIYLQCAIRQAVLDGKKGIYWLTPEEFSYADRNKGT
jgi:superfamily II DNA or RNA helicase